MVEYGSNSPLLLIKTSQALVGSILADQTVFIYLFI